MYRFIVEVSGVGRSRNSLKLWRLRPTSFIRKKGLDARCVGEGGTMDFLIWFIDPSIP